jgi:hypothetical protein
MPIPEPPPLSEAEITAKIEHGHAEIEAGQGIDASVAMTEIARKYGLTIPSHKRHVDGGNCS